MAGDKGIGQRLDGSDLKQTVPPEKKYNQESPQLDLEKQRQELLDRLRKGDSSVITELEYVDPEIAEILSNLEGLSEEGWLSAGDLNTARANWRMIRGENIYKLVTEKHITNIDQLNREIEGPQKILVFHKLRKIDNRQAAAQLAKFNGTLYFDSLEDMDDDSLWELCARQAPLFMPALTTVSKRGIEILAERSLKTVVSQQLQKQIMAYKEDKRRVMFPMLH